MGIFNKKRNKDEYLKYENGDVISLGDKGDFPKDRGEINKEYNKENEIYDNDDNNEEKINPTRRFRVHPNGQLFDEITDEENINENKKTVNISKILIRVGSLVVMIPILYLGFNIIKNNKNDINDIISSAVIDSSVNDTVEDNEVPEKKEESNNQTISDNSKSNSMLSEEENTEIINIVSEINNINKNIYSTLEGTKTDVLNYNNGTIDKVSAMSSFSTRKIRIISNISIIEEMEPMFKNTNLENVYKLLIDRYNNLLDVSNSLINCSKDDCISITNDAIINNNELFRQQTKLLKTYLDNAGVSYSEIGGEFDIK